MKQPTWTISAAIRREAESKGGYLKLAHHINAKIHEMGWSKAKGIDRRKLKAIVEGKEITISTPELMALDNYFSPMKEGFADHPLFERHSLIENVAENENFIALLGAYQRNEPERNDVSLWDVMALREILTGMQQFREVIHEALETVPFFDGKAKHNRNMDFITELMNKSKRSICCIGSPRSNVASEIILAEMFGVKPFVRSSKNEIPFKFFWTEEAERKRGGFVSAFECVAQEVAKNADPSFVKAAAAKRAKALLVGNNLIYEVIPHRFNTWDDYGIVAVQRQANDKIRIVLAGLTGPSTYAAAQACCGKIAASIPAAGKGYKTLWSVVKARVSPGKEGIGDTRVVESIDVIGEPQIYESQAVPALIKRE